MSEDKTFYVEHIYGDSIPAELKSTFNRKLDSAQFKLSSINPIVECESPSNNVGSKRQSTKYSHREVSSKLDDHSTIRKQSWSPNHSSPIYTSRTPPPKHATHGHRDYIVGYMPKSHTWTSSDMRGHRKKLTKREMNSTTDFYCLDDEDSWNGKSLNHRKGGLKSSSYQHVRSVDPQLYGTHYDYAREPRKTTPSLRRLVEETDGEGQYRTILYVIPTSPRVQSPMFWDDQMIKRSESKSNKNRHHLEEERIICSDCGKTSGSYGVTGHRETRSCLVKSYSDEGYNIERSGTTRTAETPKIVFQGPGRYLEERPYYQTLPSPKQMHINPHVSNPHTLINHQPPSPLKVNRTDYNRVVVDIKPRQLHEADKQHHVSQWIEVGTLGDTMGTKIEGSDSNPEDMDSNLIMNPADDDYHMQSDTNVYGTNPATSELKVTAEQPTSNEVDNKQHAVGALGNNTYGYHTQPVHKQIREIFETIPEESSISETAQTNSARDNTEDTDVTKERMTRYYSQNDVLEGHTSSVGPKTVLLQDMDPNAVENVNSHNLTKDRRVTRAHWEPPIENKPAIPQSTERTSADTKQIVPPTTAPKPSPRDQLAIMLDKRPMSTPVPESWYMRDPVSIRLLSPPYTHGTFPKTTESRSKYAASHNDMHLHDATQENTLDAPVSKVRSLAAYFTELIKKQTDSSVVSSAKLNNHNAYDMDISDERELSLASSPVSMRHESHHDRQRRLQATESLRKRSATQFTMDYTKTGCKLPQYTHEEPYPYVRSSSAPRPHIKHSSMDTSKPTSPLVEDD